MNSELWLSVLGLAALDTMSPTTLGITIAVLLSSRRVAARTLLYLATLAACYFLFGVGLMLGLDAAIDLDPMMDESLAPVFFGLGVVLLALSFVIDPGTKAAKQARRERAAERVAARRRDQGDRLLHGGALAMIGLGLTTFVLEFATVVPYLAAIGLMTANEVPEHTWVPALGVYNLIMVTPSLLLLTAKLALSERLRPRFEVWEQQLDAAVRPVAAWVVGIVGILFMAQTAGSVLG